MQKKETAKIIAKKTPKVKGSEMKLEASVYSQAGKEVSKVTLSPKVFGVAWNANLVHDVVVGMQSNARSNTAHAKNRGEIRGGGKKPWKQKGTGRARHGSTRSPIWVGGGVSHGPRNDRDYSVKINKNTRAKALASVLSQKFEHNEVIFVDALMFAKPQAREARSFLNALSTIDGMKSLATKRANAALIILPERDEHAELSFRNFGNIATVTVKDVNPVELLTYKYVVVAKPEASLKTLETRVVTKTARRAMTVKS
jgi:large subunit ribosomal protein L4